MTAWPPAGWPHRGVIAEAPVLPIEAKFPDAALDYTIDIPCAIDPAVDFVSSVTLACAPSGTGEMQISALTFANEKITYTATGGQPGRHYRLKFIATMTNGRVFAFVGVQPVTPVLPSDRPSPPPSMDFGAVLTWNYAPGLNFSLPRNSMYLL